MMTKNSLEYIEIEEHPPIQKSLIWLHGLGADGSDFAPIVPELNLPASLGVRFIFPHAPVMPVTINNGYEMPAWFDIYALSLESKIDMEGIKQSADAVEQLIVAENKRGVASSDIVLVGFSQGATLALATALCYPERLAGVIALSGFLPAAQEVLARATDANRALPIFLAHGMQDPIVPYVLGEMTRAELMQANYAVNWHSYAMPHTVCGEEVRDIGEWLRKVWKV